MEPLPPSTRRANFWLFVTLVVFAIALAIVVFVWMRGVVRANGGIADPQRKTTLFVPGRELALRAAFVLPTAALCFT